MSTEPAPQSKNTSEARNNRSGGFYENVPDEPGSRGETLKMVIVAFAIVLFGLTMVVVFVLPRYLPDSANPTSAPSPTQSIATAEKEADSRKAETPEPNAAEPAPREPADPAAQLAAREKAQQLLGEIDQQINKLDAQNVSVWAGEKFTAAKAQLQTGEQAYGEQRYEEAIELYSAVSDKLKKLEEQSGSVLTDALAEGEYALSSEDSVAAKQAFERALLIQADNDAALAGKQRAENLDEVIALVNEAKGFEDLGDTTKALERYEAALALDTKTTNASEAIKRIKAQQNTSAFNAAMTRGLNALEAKKYGEARKHFTAATKIKPGNSDARESLQQANDLIRSSEIQRHLRNAATNKNKEDWSAVEKSLLSAKKLDKNIAGINTQIDSARDRQTLERQLLKYTNEAHRLRDENVHLEALSLLDKAKRYTAGPKLKQQISTLEQTISAARSPQDVVITSDAATQVTVFKVGQLGVFTQKNLSLLPGKYVAVGKRNGFRDVRIEFNVRANSNTPSTVDVRCVEQVQFGPG